MYGMGETELERQTRLQADADAERAISTLRDAQIGSLPEITVKGNPTVFYILTAAILTGLLFPLGSKRRSLWLLFLFLPSVLGAQQWQQQVVSGGDTFTVYGKYATTTVVTVDSMVKKLPPVILGVFYGPTAGFDKSPLAPFTASGGESAAKPQWLLDKIAEARTRKAPFIANLPCGSHNVSNLGNCLTLVNGVAIFSQARFDSALATYNTPQVKAAVAQAVTDTILLGINIMDEPWVTAATSGDGNTWGPPGTMTRARVDSLCTKAKTVFGSTVPIGTSDQTKWQRTGPWKVCDIGIAQYSYRFGNVVAWRDSILAISTAQKYGSVFSINWINGGTQDRNGPWDCPGSVKGQRSPNCQMTPAQLDTTSAFLPQKTCGVYTAWRYDQARMALPGYPASFTLQAQHAAELPRVLCKVR